MTGASGYVGGVVTEHLARLPEVERITAVDRSRPSRSFSAKVCFREMDIRSPSLSSLMAGHNVVVHAAAVVLWSRSMSEQTRDDINLNGTRNVALAALANRVERFLQTSSMAVYDPYLARGQSGVTEDFPMGKEDRFFYYWSNKAAAERIVAEVFAESSTLVTCLRPIYIVGPHNRATVSGLRDNAINFLGHDPRRQFVHEDDVASAFCQALRFEMPGAYNVVPDDFLRMSEVWRLVGVRSVRTVPAWLARSITAFRWRFLGSPVHPSWVQDILVDFTGSSAKLKSTGWSPRYNSAEALRSAL
ncbi:MAG: NAD-dependent epimerase/dehydratase family protein [Verrucomicrobia bacterium]|nr:NAD-dependent epimerase/dehydratase family protein [Verrucomicrobiota bacterium]